MAPLNVREKTGEWTATVTANGDRGGGYHQLSLALPAHHPIPRAGAFMMLSVGREPEMLLRRPMAFFDAVKKGNRVRVEVLYSVAGKGTRSMLSLVRGAKLSLLGPIGNSFSQPEKGERFVIAAGGIGIAPFLLWGRQLDPSKRKSVRLLLGFANKEQKSIIRNFERIHLKPKVAIEGPGGDFCGTVVELLEQEMEAEPFDRILTCGPSKMMEKVEALAAERQIPCELSLEAKMGCGLGLCLSCVTRHGAGESGGYSLVCQDGPVFLR
jgi:dihydroorotate dehydrogenase electron transfer subunit